MWCYNDYFIRLVHFFIGVFLLLLRLGELKTKCWQHTELDWRELSFLKGTRRIWRRFQLTCVRTWPSCWPPAWTRCWTQPSTAALQSRPGWSTWIANFRQAGWGYFSLQFHSSWSLSATFRYQVQLGAKWVWMGVSMPSKGRCCCRYQPETALEGHLLLLISKESWISFPDGFEYEKEFLSLCDT